MSAIEVSRNPRSLVTTLAALLILLAPGVGFSEDGCGKFLKSLAEDGSGKSALPDNQRIDHTLALSCHVSMVAGANTALNASYGLERRKLTTGFERKLEVNRRTAIRLASATKQTATSRWFRWPVRLVAGAGVVLAADDVYELLKSAAGNGEGNGSVSRDAIQEAFEARASAKL